MNTNHASAHFSVTSWDEQTWDGQPHDAVPGRRLTLARITYAYKGALEGTSEARFVMAYRDDGTADYTGLEEFTGSLHGKAGAFVLRYEGEYANSTARATCTIVPGSGTGELSGISGTAESIAAGHQPEYPFTLEYSLP